MSDMTAHMEHDQETLMAEFAGTPAPDVTAKRRRIGFGFWLAVAWLVIVILAALLAPWLPLKDPEKSFVVAGERPPYAPSREFWFGTDQLSRDMFSRSVWGARISLTVGFASIALGMLVGGSLGMIAGYFRGKYNSAITAYFVVVLSFPGLMLLILITSLLNRTLFTIAFAFGFLAIPSVGMVSRASTIAYADREFVLAARTLGAKHPRIILRELLPNVVIPMSAFAFLAVAVAIVAEGGLAFLGLSVQNGITWGKLIQNGAGRSDLEDAPWIAFSPILMLFLTVLSLNFAGDSLRSHFDVKETAL